MPLLAPPPLFAARVIAGRDETATANQPPSRPIAGRHWGSFPFSRALSGSTLTAVRHQDQDGRDASSLSACGPASPLLLAGARFFPGALTTLFSFFLFIDWFGCFAYWD
ncbi:hypothetical protein VIGAN_05194900 [Vigna angularis var. angularis]|uniref:Uncharacterized protein n=1 Tax=Vigna angularis var. angularis TaxID=157739 RepID=A0A0S3S6J9_PHAAN|nr:hypothetical protein VIGAN_05194900 [Vigna angularis var. angularis]